MANGRFHNRMNRRGFLTVGAIGLGGLTLADVLRLQARADLKSYAAITAKADSVIHIFLPGGIAHQETFDPKPLPRSNTGATWVRSRPRSKARSSARRFPRLPSSPTSSR